MILGIGTDLVLVKRIKKSIENPKFVKNIFTEKEILYCRKFKLPEIHFAARFSAKESLLKALGTGLRGRMSFKDIEITNDNLGKPIINISGEVKQKATDKKISKIHLSMTHTSEYASSFVIVE